MGEFLRLAANLMPSKATIQFQRDYYERDAFRKQLYSLCRLVRKKNLRIERGIEVNFDCGTISVCAKLVAPSKTKKTQSLSHPAFSPQSSLKLADEDLEGLTSVGGDRGGVHRKRLSGFLSDVSEEDLTESMSEPQIIMSKVKGREKGKDGGKERMKLKDSGKDITKPTSKDRDKSDGGLDLFRSPSKSRDSSTSKSKADDSRPGKSKEIATSGEYTRDGEKEKPRIRATSHPPAVITNATQGQGQGQGHG
eukprot:CAMPEP_0177677484 /NCGR_PEP_ID=MMETSP0447-20121125/28420_1 /TAXON_ID=0 /ORGANISM="Stygamoeba regulata, Strain BSH-02190019" /LENGTH=250 /DNA_ID=CAMNT_0019186263 /DNA_START=262 /DNA_END=1011 /DNA_ORIENTATION=-